MIKSDCEKLDLHPVHGRVVNSLFRAARAQSESPEAHGVSGARDIWNTKQQGQGAANVLYTPGPRGREILHNTPRSEGRSIRKQLLPA